MAATMNAVSERKASFERTGFWIEKGLLSPAEAAELRDAFMAMHEAGGVPGFYEYNANGVDDRFKSAAPKGDPLALYPRVMHPHRFMPIARRYFLDSRLFDRVEEFLGEEALAAQTMLYFKPPGARGQAWHQDNFYINVKPGTCLAAWVALDETDDENGGLKVVPRTQNLPVICPTDADPSVSFTKEEVPLSLVFTKEYSTYASDLKAVPEGIEVARPRMNPGDVLFFNGSIVHGSEPNRTKDRFRRSFICHYVPASCRELARFYHPLLSRQGAEVGRAVAPKGGPCGTEASGPH